MEWRSGTVPGVVAVSVAASWNTHGGSEPRRTPCKRYDDRLISTWPGRRSGCCGNKSDKVMPTADCA